MQEKCKQWWHSTWLSSLGEYPPLPESSRGSPTFSMQTLSLVFLWRSCFSCLSGGIALSIGVHSKCSWEGTSFGSSYAAILDLPPPFYYKFYMIFKLSPSNLWSCLSDPIWFGDLFSSINFLFKYDAFWAHLFLEAWRHCNRMSQQMSLIDPVGPSFMQG